ncbi:MAG: hypothetical protein IJ039_04635 [Clostridia bacterium]|nr:hypothetical protein [Clostridia bacterium]
MKKIISILAVLCMCFCLCAVFASCGHEHTWNEGEIVKAATREADGTKKFTCTECEETKEESFALVTTITEEQWKAAWALDNFTASVKVNGEVFSDIKADNGSAFMDVGSMEMYLAKKDGTLYTVVEIAGQTMATPMPETEMTLSGLSSDGQYDDIFSSLTYDETEKAYVFVSEDGVEKVYFYFADGQLEKFLSFDGLNVGELTPSSPVDEENYSITESILTDIGTTEVNVPDFEV